MSEVHESADGSAKVEVIADEIEAVSAADEVGTAASGRAFVNRSLSEDSSNADWLKR